jgi:hypothetical protein
LIHQFDSPCRQLTELLICETDNDFCVTTGRSKSVPKGVNSSRQMRRGFAGMQKSHSPFSWFLRARGQRPHRDRTAENGDEIAPFHTSPKMDASLRAVAKA